VNRHLNISLFITNYHLPIPVLWFIAWRWITSNRHLCIRSNINWRFFEVWSIRHLWISYPC